MFIVFDGIDGSGKTRQADLMHEFCRQHGLSSVVHRDPGGTPAGSKIREILLNKSTPLSAVSQALLFAASRTELAQVIAEDMKTYDVVISDRWLLSTLSYQCHLQNVDRKFVFDLYRSTVKFAPDVYVIIDLDAKQALQRKAGKMPDLGACSAPKDRRENVRRVADRERELESSQDRFESMGAAKQEKIREGFLKEAEQLQRAYWSSFVHVDGNFSPDVIGKMVRDEVSKLSTTWAKMFSAKEAVA